LKEAKIAFRGKDRLWTLLNANYSLTNPTFMAIILFENTGRRRQP